MSSGPAEPAPHIARRPNSVDELALAYLRTGSDADWKALHAAIEGLIYKIALDLARVSSGHTFDDVKQETVLAVMRTLKKWDVEKSSCTTYIYNFAGHLARRDLLLTDSLIRVPTHARESGVFPPGVSFEGVRDEDDDGPPSSLEVAPDDGQSPEDAARFEELLACLNSMPAVERECALWSAVGGGQADAVAAGVVTAPHQYQDAIRRARSHLSVRGWRPGSGRE